MKQIDIQRTPTGYEIRQSKSVRTQVLLFSALPLIPYAGIALPGLFPMAPRNLFPWLFALLLWCIIMGYVCYLNYSFRLVIDEQGVHRYAFNCVKRSFLWRHIRSCDIAKIPPSANEGRVIPPSFYVSTEKEVENMKNCLFIRLQNKKDEQALRESGLLNFCRRQIADTDRKFK